MGRGVNYLNRAQKITYIDNSQMGHITPLDEDGNEIEGAEPEFDEFQASQDWDDFKENLISLLTNRLSSLSAPYKPRWEDREVEIILENNLAEIGLSDYCGCTSVSIRPIDSDGYDDFSGLASHWISQIWPGVERELKGENTVIRKLGTFSNGESVYERAA
jgi:hypothetical protein